MKRSLSTAVVLIVSLSLTGCTLFYPNWGATTAPVVTPTDSASPTAEPSETPTTPPKPKQPVTVDIVQSETDSVAGTISVIAQAR